MAKQYKSEALAAVHETAVGLTESGVMAKCTMRAFDEMCLTPVVEMSPEAIRELRIRENASQAAFARYLNVTTSLVSQWERVEKRPRGASLKLLTLVAKNGLGAVALSLWRRRRWRRRLRNGRRPRRRTSLCHPGGLRRWRCGYFRHELLLESLAGSAAQEFHHLNRADRY